MRRILLTASVVCLGIMPAEAAAPTAAPMHTSGAKAVYPRLTAFADAAVMARVNAALAAREKEDRASVADCLVQARQAHVKIGKDENWTEIRVAYLSAGYLSIEVNAQFNCGGPYPGSAQTPMTFDLATGRPVDWSVVFKRGFWPSGTAGGNGAVSGLTKLYRAHYAYEKGDEDCRDAITGQDPFDAAPIVMLDTAKGLVVWPDFPHVIQACANAVALTASDLAPYVKDQRLLGDLKAVVKPNAAKGGSK